MGDLATNKMFKRGQGKTLLFISSTKLRRVSNDATIIADYTAMVSILSTKKKCLHADAMQSVSRSALF